MREIKTLRDILRAISDGHTVEYKTTFGEVWDTIKTLKVDVTILDVELLGDYRIKPTKPSIDWSHVSEELKYLAVDDDGQGFLFKDKPTTQEGGYWFVETPLIVNARGFNSYKAGNCDWRDSLVERPEVIRGAKFDYLLVDDLIIKES